jgi:Fic family protein
MRRLVADWEDVLVSGTIHPLIALVAFNLDFLCIHPFRDGNGRVSRLLLLAQCYRLGFEVGRYISLERIIEENKERYYETLEISSQGWHDGKHDPWPFVNFALYILKLAYKEFEARVGQTDSPRGSKTELVRVAFEAMPELFTIQTLIKACPGVSQDLIRKSLATARRNGEVVCLGRGPNAQWEKKGNSLKRGKKKG